MAAGRTSESVASSKLPKRSLCPAGTRRPAGYCDGGGLKMIRPSPDLVAPSARWVRTGLGGAANFSYWQCYKLSMIRKSVQRFSERSCSNNSLPVRRRKRSGPVAQLDRASDFYSEGCRFESCRDRQRSRESPLPSRFTCGRMPVGRGLHHAAFGNSSVWRCAGDLYFHRRGHGRRMQRPGWHIYGTKRHAAAVVPRRQVYDLCS